MVHLLFLDEPLLRAATRPRNVVDVIDKIVLSIMRKLIVNIDNINFINVFVSDYIYATFHLFITETNGIIVKCNNTKISHQGEVFS